MSTSEVTLLLIKCQAASNAPGNSGKKNSSGGASLVSDFFFFLFNLTIFFYYLFKGIINNCTLSPFHLLPPDLSIHPFSFKLMASSVIVTCIYIDAYILNNTAFNHSSRRTETEAVGSQ